MLYNRISKTIKVLVVMFIICTLFFYSFAETNNEITNTISENTVTNGVSENTATNEVRQLTLKEQQEQVKKELENSQIQLSYVEEELSSTLVIINELEEKINRYQKQADIVNVNYKELQKKVSTAETELNKIQAEYDKNDKLMKKRLVELYKSGTTNYLNVLLGSKDVIDLISNFYIVERIVETDTKNLEKINTQKQQIERITNELKEAKAKMKLAKVEAEKQATILTNTKTVVDSYKQSLDESEKEILSKIDAYKKQQEELENLISYAIYASNYDLKYSGGVMIWPTLETAYISSPFGTRLHPIQGIMKNHAGIDIGANMGDPVYAAADGVVIYSSYNSGGYGNMVMVDHGTNEQGVKIITLYGHGSELLLDVGTNVKKGDVIMKIGSTGNSTGPHLHFEVRENGSPVDPKKYLSSNEENR